MNRIAAAVLGVVVIALVGVSFVRTAEPEGGDPESYGLDIRLEYLDGSTGNLSDFAGRPVVLNFWASWCPACVAEMPDFQAVHEEFGDEVVFIGLRMQEVDPAAAAVLIDQTGVEYLLADDPEGAIYRSFNSIAMPTTVFVTADGTIADVHAGAIFAEDLEAKIREQIFGS
jgi:thiol-disulfide isomerase/thioredoxin